MYNKFRELNNNPPKLNFLAGSKEFKLELISAMCDNRHTLTASIADEGKRILLRYTFGSFSNIQCKYDYDDVKWAIEEALIDGNAKAFDNAIKMLNTSTSRVASVTWRPVYANNN